MQAGTLTVLSCPWRVRTVTGNDSPPRARRYVLARRRASVRPGRSCCARRWAASKALAAGDLPAALAALDTAREQAAQGRRVLKAAASGRHAPATRPGGLRDLVAEHLRTFPGAAFTRTRSARYSPGPPARSPTP